MIKVTRLPKPKILREKETLWTDELCQERQRYYYRLNEYELGFLEEKPRKPVVKQSRYAHPQIVEVLETMFHRKCAYCESKIQHISSEHLEHFRPQSLYPRLAYKWRNLLIACPACNSIYKRARFPLLPDGRQPKEDKDHPCALDDSDSNAIVNPCEDIPQQFLVFYNEYLAPLDQHRAKLTIRVCGLNRPDLIDERRRYLERVKVAISALKLARKHGNVAKQKEYCARLQRYAHPTEPYTAMVRDKLQAEGVDLAQIWGNLST